MSVELCFACGKPLKRNIDRQATGHQADAIDGQRVTVGPDCFKKIQRAGAKGWQPPAGGPRLYLTEVYRGS